MSVNLLTQATFDGVEDGYFFENNFTNHPPMSTNECMRETVHKMFSSQTRFPFSTAAGRASIVKPDGTLISDEDSYFPYEIILVPNRDAFPKEAMLEGEDILDFLTKFEF